MKTFLDYLLPPLLAMGIGAGMYFGLEQGRSHVELRASLPATGPHHAGPGHWDSQRNNAIQTACFQVVYKLAAESGHLTDADLPLIKEVTWKCLNQNNQVF